MAVELHAAFVWDCDECGSENFERAIEGNFDEAAIEEAAEHAVGFLATNEAEEVDGGMVAEVLMQIIAIGPSSVTCRHCGHKFETELWEDENANADDE